MQDYASIPSTLAARARYPEAEDGAARAESAQRILLWWCFGFTRRIQLNGHRLHATATVAHSRWQCVFRRSWR